MKKLFAEFFGTFWLVLAGCGTAIFSSGVPETGSGILGVALAFGLTVLTMVYAVGHIREGILIRLCPSVCFSAVVFRRKISFLTSWLRCWVLRELPEYSILF